MTNAREFISSCLMDAAKAIEKARKAGLSIKYKGRNDKATSADLASESLIAGRIRKEYPGAKILSEESYAQKDLWHDLLFVIDPIDGTHNFIQGLPVYGISLALYSSGKPVAGGTYMIPQKELFYAEKGRDATLNGRRIRVSGTRRLEDFFLLSDSRLHMVEEEGKLGQMVRLEGMSQHTRFIGATIYEMCYVAFGIADASLHFRIKPYDFAACAFIAEKAGAKVSDFEGRPWSLSTQRFLASNGKQHSRILEVLNGN
ncbi:MAG: hypothetical protein A3J70_03735 [Elusimicrobia bacterium RIFCSPHIGHO2_02_FULL_61_10]|nr:MAG: hypothetical protein A3J70_03735 [Elusimicrobia bacterium RIFCSPHIGHO2_02_FULL_61_10]